MKGWLAAAALAVGLGAQTVPAPPAGPVPAGDEIAPRLERWRYNARERTELGLGHLEAGAADAAAEAFATAGRLAPEDPLARFNAGTAALLAGDQPAERALEDLEFASENAGSELAPAATYNLGNARLAAGDAAGAVEAYKDSLRRQPADRAVKHNLEVALRRLEQQQQEQQEQEQQQNQQQQDQQQQPEEGEDPGEESDPEPGDEPQPEGDETDEGDEPREPPGPRELPDFTDQPDMSAQEAAAILEAVENLERDERRRQAAERASRQSKKGKDW